MTDFAYAAALAALLFAAAVAGRIAFGPAHGRETWDDSAARLLAALVAGACVVAGVYLPRA